MDKEYRQLGLRERKEIEEGLAKGESFRKIAELIGRSPSTVSREVRENRCVRSFKQRKSACRDRDWCKRINVCAECIRKGAYCSECDVRDCRDHCAAYAERTACDVLTRAPWVCNGCRKNRYGCNRAMRSLSPGDVVTVLSDRRDSTGQSELTSGPTVTIGDDGGVITEKPLEQTNYRYAFIVSDIFGNQFISSVADFVMQVTPEELESDVVIPRQYAADVIAINPS